MTNPSPLESIFFAALGKHSPAERVAFLNEACAGNNELRASVERMLAAQAEAGSFLERPAIAGDATSFYELPISECPGSIIGPYKLLQQIGEGGMGVVFMAEQTEPIQRMVALKIIKPGMDTRQVIARFEAERQALAMMDHPNIAKVLDAGTTDSGRPYFVMELVKGVPITKYCDEKHLPLRARLELMLPVCQAVQHAHQKGLIHRDIKPTNVLVAEYDDQPVPKVIDFGVAKATAQKLTDRTMFTEFGQVIGTMEYMSPEQAKLNQLDIDTRSDIYSLGVLLYELLTGSTPFERKRLQEAAFDEMLRIIREEEPPKPSTRLSTAEGLPNIAVSRGSEPKKLCGLVRGELDWVVMKALEKDRNRRYETANGLAIDLQHYLAGDAVLAVPPSAGYRLRKFIRRNHLQVIAGSLVFVALLAGIAGTTIGLIEAKRQERLAVQASQRESERADAEAKERQRADEEKQRAIRFRDQALEALRATTSADVEKLIGSKTELSKNERDYLEAIATRWQSFAKQLETDVDTRTYQAEGHFRVASLWEKLGRREEAREEYQVARDGQQALVAQFPAVPEYQQDLAKSRLNLGILLAEVGRRDEALVELQAALDLQTRLADQHPDMSEYQGFLAIQHYNFGALLSLTGKREKALIEFQFACDLQRKLVEQFPALPDYREALGHFLSNRGILLIELGRQDEALSEYQSARDVQQALAEQFPAVPSYQVGLAETHSRLGTLLAGLGKRDEAGLAHAAARDIRKKLAEQFPAVPAYQIDLGGGYCDYGSLIRDDGKPTESLVWFDNAIRVLQAVHQQEPLDVTAKEYLRNSHSNRARAYDLLQKPSVADNDWDLAVELSPMNERSGIRASRAISRMQSGLVAEAVADVSELTNSEQWSATQWYDFACLYALASGKIADKKAEYADRAMELLRKAVMVGFNQATVMAKDSNLDSLRDREDFKKLLESMRKSPTPIKP